MYVRLALIGTIVGYIFHRIKFGKRDSLDLRIRLLIYTKLEIEQYDALL